MVYCVRCTVSANHPSLQPKGWIVKGAAQQDQPNGYENTTNVPYEKNLFTIYCDDTLMQNIL